MSKGTKWTDDEVKTAIRLFNEEHKTPLEISKIMGTRSKNGVQTKLNKLGHYHNPYHNKSWNVSLAIELHERKYGVDYIAKECGVPKSTVYKALKDRSYTFHARPKFWNKDREDKLEELILEGKTPEDIGKYFGKSKTAILSRIGILYGTQSMKKVKKFIETGDY